MSEKTPVPENAGQLRIEASVRLIEPVKNLVAFASVRIADSFVVNNIKIVEGEKGLFVDMPSVKGADGKYHNIAFPITAQFRERLTSSILDKYAAAVDRARAMGAAQHEITKKPSIESQLREGKEKVAQYQASKAIAPDVSKRHVTEK